MKFEYANPKEVGLNADVLTQMLCELEEKAELHSIVIMKDDKVIVDGSWMPYEKDVPQMMHSLSKTGTSLCVGIAASEGKLSLDDKFIEYVREDLPENYDRVLDQVTIYDLLTMQAGSAACANNVYFTALKSDWERTWLGEKRIAEDVGKAFHYDSGCSYTLSKIVSKVMGTTCINLLQERVFSKIGIDHVDWLHSPEGFNTGGWGMYLTARQIARLGQLFLHGGRWNEEQIIPADWVHEMSLMRISKPGCGHKVLSGYGYHFHTGEKLYAAEGAFGQLLICFRELPVVIGITSGTNCEFVPDICQKYIYQALEKQDGNFNGAALAQKMESLHLPFAGGESASDEKEDSLFGRWLLLNQNPREIRKVRFDREDGHLIRIKFELSDSTVKTAWAGYQCWVKNDLFTDYTKRLHCLSYAFSGGVLTIADCMINTSYREEYTFDFSGATVVCGWKPNVTYLDGNDNSKRVFMESTVTYHEK